MSRLPSSRYLVVIVCCLLALLAGCAGRDAYDASPAPDEACASGAGPVVAERVAFETFRGAAFGGRCERLLRKRLERSGFVIDDESPLPAEVIVSGFAQRAREGGAAPHGRPGEPLGETTERPRGIYAERYTCSLLARTVHGDELVALTLSSDLGEDLDAFVRRAVASFLERFERCCSSA